MGGNDMVNPVTCIFFTSLKHLLMLLKFFFLGLHFYTISVTDTVKAHIVGSLQLIFLAKKQSFYY